MVTAAFLGKTNELALILDLMLSGVSWQEPESPKLISVLFLLLI